MDALRRLARRSAPARRLPSIELREQLDYFMAWARPEPLRHAGIHAGDGRQVGTVSYSVSPLRDRVYVFEIKTTERRQGYGLQAVLAVAERYDMPVTPVHIVGSAIGFWEAAGRHLALHGRCLTDEVRCSEMDREAAKWAHLRPTP